MRCCIRNKSVITLIRILRGDLRLPNQKNGIAVVVVNIKDRRFLIPDEVLIGSKLRKLLIFMEGDINFTDTHRLVCGAAQRLDVLFVSAACV